MKTEKTKIVDVKVELEKEFSTFRGETIKIKVKEDSSSFEEEIPNNNPKESSDGLSPLWEPYNFFYALSFLFLVFVWRYLCLHF